MLSLGCSALRARNAMPTIRAHKKLAHPIKASDAASSVDAMSPVASKSDISPLEAVEEGQLGTLHTLVLSFQRGQKPYQVSVAKQDPKDPDHWSVETDVKKNTWACIRTNRCQRVVL